MSTDLLNSAGAQRIFYTSRMANNTCQGCGHNSSFDMRLFGCANCGHDGTRDTKLVWDSLHQEWDVDWQAMI